MTLADQEQSFIFKTTGLLVPLYGYIKFEVFMAVERVDFFFLFCMLHYYRVILHALMFAYYIVSSTVYLFYLQFGYLSTMS